jgi:hypothetical protein
MNVLAPFTNRHLNRRTVLRGMGAAVALPWLDAMLPARGAARFEAPRRVLFVFSPNGKKMDDWTPTAEGNEFELPHSLAPLAAVRERMTVFSGLAIDGGRAHGDGPGDHARSAGSFLTCAHPRKTGGADLHCGVSIDQVIAGAVGGATAFASLELGLERGAAAGVCDSGYSCAYSNNISWRTPSTPVARETDPKVVFARLFGDPHAIADAAARERNRLRRRSILDAVLSDAKALSRDLGAADRNKLDDYLSAVRELEQRLSQSEVAEGAPPLPDGLMAAGDSRQRLDLLYEVLALSLVGDRTRVASLMLGNAGSNRSYPFLGVPEGHHELSHHGRKADKLASIRKIDRHHSERFAAFLTRLSAHDEGDGDLLGRTAIVFAAGIGDGDRHNHDHLPVLLCGGDRAGVRGGRHVRFAKETPMANLYLALQQWMGAGGDTFADSTGPLDLTA